MGVRVRLWPTRSPRRRAFCARGPLRSSGTSPRCPPGRALRAFDMSVRVVIRERVDAVAVDQVLPGGLGPLPRERFAPDSAGLVRVTR